jgi:hypothetical protein
MHFQRNPQNKILTFCYYYYWSHHDVSHGMFTSRQNYLGPFFEKHFCLMISWCLQLIEDGKNQNYKKKRKTCCKFRLALDLGFF